MIEDSKERERMPLFSSEGYPSILVVDDLQDNLDLMEALLQDEGYESLFFATSGSDALLRLEEVPSMALVLLDLMMPGMDGYEVCRRIRTNPRTAHIPVIVVTGGAMRHDDALRKSYAAGATDFIQKPVNEIELYGRVQTALLLFEERMYSRRKAWELFESEIGNIGAFAGNMARDIHSFLAVINTCSTSILAQENLPAPVGELVKKIHEAVTGVEALNEQLKTLTNPRDGGKTARGGAKKSAFGRARKKTILLLEDEADLRHLTTVILSEQGYRVLAADSGPMALELWSQAGAEIDLLLSDIVIPDGMTGSELAQRLLKEKPGLKILFTSGYPLASLSCGGDLPHTFDFIQKPYTPNKLTYTVEKVLQGIVKEA